MKYFNCNKNDDDDGDGDNNNNNIDLFPISIMDSNGFVI